MEEIFKIDLTLFEGAEGGGSAPAEGTADGLTEGEESIHTPEINVVGEQEQNEPTQEQKKAEFERLIQEEYKDIYKDIFEERIQPIIDKNAQEIQRMNNMVGQYAPLVDLLGERYGIESGNVEDIIKAINQDNSFYEEAAMKEGMTVEQYKTMLQMKMENKQLIEAQRRAEQIRQRDETWTRWDKEAEICRSHFPEFDMNREVQNENFVRLLGSGFDVETAYKACHFDEIMNGVMTRTQSDTKKKVADTIRSGYVRPVENQLGGNTAITQKLDVEHMSNKEIVELIERAKSGEQIVF